MNKIPAILIFSILASIVACASPSDSKKEELLAQMEFNRSVTLKDLDDIEKTGKADQALRWSVSPEHAPVGWHFMHLASTEDKFASMMSGKPLVSEKLAEQFSSGQDANRDVPSLPEVRRYLQDSRQALVAAIQDFDYNRLDEKPAPDARFDFKTMLKVIVFHEPHHQGQAHATFNLYKKP
ncbi:MAG: DinB family protein [Leptospiraceae bacterium]|nr:DinB family protein [Leptospiraceae bacterium]